MSTHMLTDGGGPPNEQVRIQPCAPETGSDQGTLRGSKSCAHFGLFQHCCHARQLGYRINEGPGQIVRVLRFCTSVESIT